MSLVLAALRPDGRVVVAPELHNGSEAMDELQQMPRLLTCDHLQQYVAAPAAEQKMDCVVDMGACHSIPHMP